LDEGKLVKLAHLTVAVVTALLITVPATEVTAGNCEFQIARQGIRYVKDTLKALERCQAKIVSGFIPDQDCWLEEKAQRKVSVAAIKYRERIQGKCFGISPSQLGFPSLECPGVTTIDQIIDCLISLQNAKVNELIASDLGLGVCSGHRALNCDDLDACTIDTCDESAGGCVNTPLCGNGTIDAFCGEQCDGLNLNGQTCAGLGFLGGGTLLCGAGCIFDTSFCIP